MINEVYKTCQSLLNKNNFGYLSPADLNLYAHQAQLDIFENYIHKYNKQVNLENIRQSGTGYAGLGQKISEDLENFSTTNFLVPQANNSFYLPSLTTTGDTWFLMNKIICYPNILDSGVNTSVVANRLINSTATFVTDGVAANDIVVNVTTTEIARVVSVTSNTTLVIDTDIFDSTSQNYAILQASTPTIAEKVSHTKITELSISLLTTPNSLFPAYTLQGSTITVLPSTLNTYGMVQGQYFRYPLVPRWSYVVIDGSPIFDGSASDYVDFELPQEEMPNLIVRILKYAGLEIREQQVEQFAQIEEQKENLP